MIYITDSYNHILFRVHDDGVITEGTSNKIVYKIQDNYITEGTSNNIVYKIQDNYITEGTYNKIVYKVQDDCITEGTYNRIVYYIKRDNESNSTSPNSSSSKLDLSFDDFVYDPDATSSYQGSYTPSGSGGGVSNGSFGLIFLAVYAIICLIIHLLIPSTTFLGVFFGIPVLIGVIFFGMWIIGGLGW